MLPLICLPAARGPGHLEIVSISVNRAEPFRSLTEYTGCSRRLQVILMCTNRLPPQQHLSSDPSDSSSLNEVILFVADRLPACQQCPFDPGLSRRIQVIRLTV